MASFGTGHNAALRTDENEKPSTSSSDDGELSDVAFNDEDERPPPAPVPLLARTTATMVQLPNKSVRLHPAPPPAHLSDPSLEAIDPEILQQLPPEIQQEILLDHAAAQKRATDAAIQDAMLQDDNSAYAYREPSDARDDELQSSSERSSDQEATTGSAGAEWTCHVCTFANHPQLPSCEICDTARPDGDHGDYDWYTDRSGSPSNPTTKPPSTLAQRIQSSAMASSLKKIKVPATPATTTLTQKDDPTAEDLLLAATNKIQQLHSSASQSLHQATNAILAKASAARRPSLLASPSSAGKPPSPQACALLTMLQQDLNTKCEPGDELYETLLVRLWNAIYQDAAPPPRKNSIGSSTSVLSQRPPLARRPFERESEAWVDIGFQGPNPDTDFRGGGLLALKCLVYVFEAFPHKMLEIVRTQAPPETGTSSRKWYPVCVAGINLTCMIAGLLRLGNGQFTSSQQLFWTLFEEPVAFYQLYFHAFTKMDAAWHRMNASFMEFGVVLKATRRMVVFMLDQAPQSLDELNVAAEKTLIDRFVIAVSQAFLHDTENGECPDPFHLLEDDNEVLITSPRSALAAITSRLMLSTATTPHSH